MAEKEAATLDRCYAVLTEENDEKWYKSAKRLTRLFGKIIARNLRAGRAVLKTKAEETAVRNAAIRSGFESDLMQQVRNEVQDTILFHAPQNWSDERCEDVENTVMNETRTVVSALSTQELRSSTALQHNINTAVAETMKRLQGR
jgi:hypothetical protein